MHEAERHLSGHFTGKKRMQMGENTRRIIKHTEQSGGCRDSKLDEDSARFKTKQTRNQEVVKEEF